VIDGAMQGMGYGWLVAQWCGGYPPSCVGWPVGSFDLGLMVLSSVVESGALVLVALFQIEGA